MVNSRDAWEEKTKDEPPKDKMEMKDKRYGGVMGICYKCGKGYYCGGFENEEEMKKHYAGKGKGKECCYDCEDTKKKLKKGEEH